MMLEVKLADPPKILATVAVIVFAALALVLLGFAPQVEAGTTRISIQADGTIEVTMP